MTSEGITYRFDEFVLDLRRGRLMTGDTEIELRPKGFLILHFLLENAGRLISKDELIRVAWPHVVVTDDALTKCVSDIRAAIGDADQAIIKTVPRRGYALVAQVLRQDGPSGNPIAATSPEVPNIEKMANVEVAGEEALPGHGPTAIDVVQLMRSRVVWILVAAGLLAMLCFVAYQSRSPWWPKAGNTASIAVLRLQNLGGDPAQDYFSDGLTDDLTTALSKFTGLVVIAPNSAFKYGSQRHDPRLIGQELSVRYVLDGNLRRQGDRLRVTARLVDTRSGTQLWAEQYDRPVGDLFQVKDDLSNKIVVSLINQVSKSELAQSLTKTPENMVAWDHYVRGTAVLRNFTAGDRGPLLAQARHHFRQALSADARYAPAMQALAQTFTAAWLEPSAAEALKGEYQKPATLDQAQALAEQAIDIDPFLADAHATLAWILHWQYQRTAALASFRRALELNPNLAEGRYSLMLTHSGDAEHGVEEMQRIMRLDPHHPSLYWTWLGNAYYLLGKDELALQALRIASSRQPKHRPTHVWLAAAAARAGQFPEAHQAAQNVLQLQPDFTIERFVGLLRLTRPTDTKRLVEGLRLAGLPE